MDILDTFSVIYCYISLFNQIVKSQDESSWAVVQGCRYGPTGGWMNLQCDPGTSVYITSSDIGTNSRPCPVNQCCPSAPTCFQQLDGGHEWVAGAREQCRHQPACQVAIFNGFCDVGKQLLAEFQYLFFKCVLPPETTTVVTTVVGSTTFETFVPTTTNESDTTYEPRPSTSSDPNATLFDNVTSSKSMSVTTVPANTAGLSTGLGIDTSTSSKQGIASSTTPSRSTTATSKVALPTTPATTTTTNSVHGDKEKAGFSIGAIVGIVVGIIAFIILVPFILAALNCIRRKAVPPGPPPDEVDPSGHRYGQPYDSLGRSTNADLYNEIPDRSNQDVTRPGFELDDVDSVCGVHNGGSTVTVGTFSNPQYGPYEAPSTDSAVERL